MYTPMLPKTVTVHRSTIRKDLTEIFTDASVLNSYLDVVVIDARGEPEKGKGKGVVLDVLTHFWNNCYMSLTVGRKHHSSGMICRNVNGKLLHASLSMDTKSMAISHFNFLFFSWHRACLGKNASHWKLYLHPSKNTSQPKTKMF